MTTLRKDKRIMVELMKAGFYPFVLTLSENVVKKVVWDIYFTIKAYSGRIPAMKLSGSIQFIFD